MKNIVVINKFASYFLEVEEKKKKIELYNRINNF